MSGIRMLQLFATLFFTSKTIAALRFRQSSDLNEQMTCRPDKYHEDAKFGAIITDHDDKHDGSGSGSELSDMEVGKIGNTMVGQAWGVVQAAACGTCGKTSYSSGTSYPTFTHLFKNGGVSADFSKMENRTSKCFDCPKNAHILKRHFQYPPYDKAKHAFFDFYVPHIRSEAKTELEAMEEDLKDALVIHLRGGDAFAPRADMLYFPPPCAFFNHVINHENSGGAFHKVVLIGEDKNHPCIKHLQEKNANLNVTWTKQSVTKDWMSIMAARNLALSTSSTFGIAPMLMNIHEKINVHLPTFSYIQPCELLEYQDGYFYERAHEEICGIGGGKVYEIPGKHIFKNYRNRKEYVRQDEFFSGTKIHTCKEGAPSGYFMKE